MTADEPGPGAPADREGPLLKRRAPGRDLSERFVQGTESGMRRVARSAAILLWIPLGFFFWLPFLFRRTLGYLIAVLYAGIAGADTKAAEKRWDQAVGFYQFGFLRILHAFRTDKEAAPPAWTAGRRLQHGTRRFLQEVLWAIVVWGTLLWLVGIWPDAPEDLRIGMAVLLDLFSEAALAVESWVRGLLD